MTTIFKEKELVVPSSIRRQAGIKTGDRLEFKVSGRVITIVPELLSADDEYTPEQRRIIDGRLAIAEADIHAGRTYGPFNTAKEMAESIEANIKKMRASRKKTMHAR